MDWRFFGVNNKEEIIAVIRSNWAGFQKNFSFSIFFFCPKWRRKQCVTEKTQTVVQHFLYVLRVVHGAMEGESIGHRENSKGKVIIYFGTKSNRKNIVIADVI